MSAGPPLAGPPARGPLAPAAAGCATLSVAAILAESAARRPAATALVHGGDVITYRALWDQTRAVAGALRARGVGRGDRVAVVVPNVPDFVRTYYAVLALGAVVVPVHLLFKAAEVEHVLRDSGARLAVVAAAAMAQALPAARAAGVEVLSVMATADPHETSAPPRLEDEVAAAAAIADYEDVGPLEAATILYTSGTTGRPRGAVGSHLAMVEQVNATLLDSVELRADDVVLGGLPLFHAFGQSAVLNLAVRRGAAIVLLPVFDADAAIEAMVARGVTVLMAVPTMFVALVGAAARHERLPGLRFAVSGGAALPVAVLQEFSGAFGAPVLEGYGLTEAGPTVTVNTSSEPPRPGTVGRPLWGVRVAVADPEVTDRVVLLDEGARGEVVVRGPNLFTGYLDDPEATARTFVDGWLRTGDVGFLDQGILTIVDRTKDLVVRNGYNVYPTEVEQVLATHPAVAAAAVFGVPDDVHGQEVHAAVVVRPGHRAEPGELVAFVRERIAAFKYPRVVHVLDTLPLGPSGKVLKRVLAAQVADGTLPAPASGAVGDGRRSSTP